MKITKTLSFIIAGILMMQCFSGCSLMSRKDKFTAGQQPDSSSSLSEKEDISIECVSKAANSDHFVFLLSDGTVRAGGNNDYGQCEVDGWTNITQILIDETSTYGLKKDGTVIIAGEAEETRKDILKWKNINELSLQEWTEEDRSITGLCNNGSFEYSPPLINTQYAPAWIRENWNNISKLYTRPLSNYGIGLKNNGELLVPEYLQDKYHSSDLLQQSNIKNIVWIGFNDSIAILNENGSVFTIEGYTDDWSQINNIYAWGFCLVGLQEDGKVRFGWDSLKDSDRSSSGNEIIINNYKERINESEWMDITKIFVSNSRNIFGIKQDGSVVSDSRILGEESVVYPIASKKDIESWRNIVDISVSNSPSIEPQKNIDQQQLMGHVAGLKEDGTVVATGGNKFGECNVEEWKDIVTIVTSPESYTDSNLWDYELGYTAGLTSTGEIVAVGRTSKIDLDGDVK